MDAGQFPAQQGPAGLFNFDKDLAREVVLKEKRVNGSELKIDRDCENIFALFCPVAIDLRFLLAVLKINTNLERIGDIAEGIAKYVIDAEVPLLAGIAGCRPDPADVRGVGADAGRYAGSL